MEHWKIEMEKSKKEKEIKKRYPELGKIVKFKGEYGIVLLSPDFEFSWDGYNPGDEVEDLCVRWDTRKEFDSEQFFFDYEYLDEYDFKYINMDGTLKDEYKK